MSDLAKVSRDDALREFADTPSTLEFRSLALAADAAVFRSGGGLLLVDASRSMICAAGAVERRDARRLYESKARNCEVLADRSACLALGEEFRFTRALISVLAQAWQCPTDRVPGLVVRPLEPDDPLDHLPGELRDELAGPRDDPAVYAGFLDRVAVSFAYTASLSETLADVSIDTLAAARRRGVARQVVSRLINHILALGRSPVWGAAEDNAASLALAASLGFTKPAGELFVHEA
jgi:GNAT superfamily N-acetyltransferase